MYTVVVLPIYYTLLCNRSLETSSSFMTETLNPLNSNSSFPCLSAPLFPLLSFLSIPHINGIIQYLSFCDWLISLSIMSSRFIHVAVWGRIFFLFLRMNSVPLYVNIYHLLFRYSFIDGHLGWFHLLVIVNNKCCNEHEYPISLWDSLIIYNVTYYNQQFWCWKAVLPSLFFLHPNHCPTCDDL